LEEQLGPLENYPGLDLPREQKLIQGTHPKCGARKDPFGN